jgi:hypothetical protein
VLVNTLATDEIMIQLPGEASRLRIRVIRAEFDHNEQLRMLLLRYGRGRDCQRSKISRRISLPPPLAPGSAES